MQREERRVPFVRPLRRQAPRPRLSAAARGFRPGKKSRLGCGLGQRGAGCGYQKQTKNKTKAKCEAQCAQNARRRWAEVAWGPRGGSGARGSGNGAGFPRPHRSPFALALGCGASGVAIRVVARSCAVCAIQASGAPAPCPMVCSWPFSSSDCLPRGGAGAGACARGGLSPSAPARSLVVVNTTASSRRTCEAQTTRATTEAR